MESTASIFLVAILTLSYANCTIGFVCCQNRALSGYYGYFSSPNFPYEYPNNHDCKWSISVPSGYNVSLEFSSFSLERQSTCRYDYVEIRDGSTAHDPLLGKYCGSKIPPRIDSSGSDMHVSFHSDEIVSKSGFSANFVAQILSVNGWWKGWIKSNRPCNKSILIRRSCTNPPHSHGGKSCYLLMIRQELRGTEFPVAKCNHSLGLEDGRISDSQISASSEWSAYHGASNARLNFYADAWSPTTNDTNPWLKIDIGYETNVTGIKTQGLHGYLWVNRYTVSYSQDNKIYHVYKNNGTAKEFSANSDRNSIVQQVLSPPILARFIRIHPTNWTNHISMRVELLGCDADKLLRFNGSSPSFGYVEVNHNNSWKFICGKQWTRYESSALCKVLGYNGTKDDGNESTADFKSNSTTAQQCEDMDGLIRSCTAKKEAHLIECKVPVRLAGSMVVYIGRVEVFLKRTWGTVCSIGWDRNDADVLCRELGFKKAVAEFVATNISDGTGPILMSDLRCKGSETSLSQCPRAEVITVENCRPAKVYCEPRDNKERLDARSHSFGVGERATIRCDLEKDQYVGWFNEENVSLSEGLQDGKDIGDSNELIIRSVQPSDGGTYQCVGKTKRRIYVIYVAFKASVPPDQSILINQDGALICEARGKPTPSVQWLKNGRPIDSGRFCQMANGTLLVNPVRRRDSGTYICRISQSYKSITKEEKKEVRVVAEGRIKIEAFEPNKTSVQGDNVPLICNASGIPPPYVKWTFNSGTPLSSWKRFSNAILLQNIQNNEEYEGSYTCYARNGWGMTKYTMFLTVDEKPKATMTRGLVTKLVGEKLELKCDVRGDPKPQVKWTKDGSSKISNAKITPPSNTTLVIESVILGEDDGLYKCEVKNRAGKTDFSSTVRIYNPEKGVTMEMIWAPLVAVILFGVLVFAGWRLKRRCSQDVSYPEVPSAPPAFVLTPVAPVRKRRPSDPWEVFEEDVVIQGFLGVGAFGEVWRAVVQHVGRIKGNRECAVKKLRVSVSRDTRKKFMKEIELGKMLGSEGHPNIVNFLGCVTRTENPMIIMEYTPHGDLLVFLRKSRGVEDRHHVGKDEPVKKLENYDLVNFAQQIACGMKFLKYKGIMHRDLAARNVLVGDDFVCKVTDFGLACQTEKYGYGSAKKGRLPTKWTAPEVLFDNSSFQISSKSDVWSYGIVVYEIFTLGGTPYPDFRHNDLIVQLSTKHYRMPKPDHISDNIYELMMLCWSEDPAGRPSFEELHETFLTMIAQKHYMDVFDEARYENQLYQPEKFASDVSSSDDPPETQERGAARATVEIEEEAGATAAEAKAVTVQIEGREEAMEIEAKTVTMEIEPDAGTMETETETITMEIEAKAVTVEIEPDRGTVETETEKITMEIEAIAATVEIEPDRGTMEAETETVTVEIAEVGPAV